MTFRITCIFVLVSILLIAEEPIPANTWVRLADSPGDSLGREVPPARLGTWVHVPELKQFIRFGGHTPQISNMVQSFSTETKKWTTLFPFDENYPETRPAGYEMRLYYDSKKKIIWIYGGKIAGSKRGIWTYDPFKKTFEFITPYRKGVGAGNMAFSPELGLFAQSPKSRSSIQHNYQTWFYRVSEKKWYGKRSKKSPQRMYDGGFPIVWHPVEKRFIVIGAVNRKVIEVWSLDPATGLWEMIESGGLPNGKNRKVFPLAYDPVSNKIMVYGGNEGSSRKLNAVLNDTWLLDVKARKWTEVKAPGPHRMTHPRTPAKKIIYCVQNFSSGLSWDAEKKQMMLVDADLGVWAFRYDEKSPAGINVIDNGWKAEIGAAALNAPAEGPKDILKKFPSPLNPRIINLADNTVIPLKGKVPGAEVGMDYIDDLGVFIKYGGCGNHGPHWHGYGNDLAFYDAGTERWLTRRTGDIAGADRPGNACTRTPVYDSKRKLVKFFGGASSGPYCPQPAKKTKGVQFYDPIKDLFIRRLPTGKPAGGKSPSGTYACYAPAIDATVNPYDNGVTYLYNYETLRLTTLKDSNSPGKLYTYNRMVYIHSIKSVLALFEVPTGKTSAEKPKDFKGYKEVAGKTSVLWFHDRAKKVWVEKRMESWVFDCEKLKWRNLKPSGDLPYRNNKFGFAYDTVNDVVILVGGHISWNGPVTRGIWVYDVKANSWAKQILKYTGKRKPSFSIALKTGYDKRHHAVIFESGRDMFAYRYKKGDWKPTQ